MCVLPIHGNSRTAGAVYTYRQSHIDCRPGAAYLLEPDTLHINTRLLGPSSYYVLKISPAVVGEVARSLARLCGALGAESEGLERETALIRTVHTLLRECAEASSREPSVIPAAGLARVREYLHAHFDRPVALSDLVAISGLSATHLIRSFGRAFGTPPHGYQNLLRVAEARRQLAAGKPVSKIEVGFFDQAHLARHFKRAYGVTPGVYRAAVAS